MNEKTLLSNLIELKISDDTSALLDAFTQLANFYRSGKRWHELETIAVERYKFKKVKEGSPGLDLVYLAGDLAGAGHSERALELLIEAESDFKAAGIDKQSGMWETLYSAKCEIYLSLEQFDNVIEHLRMQLQATKDIGAAFSNHWETKNYLADLLQFQKMDILAALKERIELWNNFRAEILSGELSHSAMRIHITNSVRLAHAYKGQNQWGDAKRIYEDLLKDLLASPFFGEQSEEAQTVRSELKSNQMA